MMSDTKKYEDKDEELNKMAKIRPRPLNILEHHIDLRCRSILTKHEEYQNWAKTLKFNILCISDFVSLHGVMGVTNAQLWSKKLNSLLIK